MTTLTLKDGGPTTTITFDSFNVTDWRLDAKGFHPVAIPDNGGAIIVFEGQWLEFLKLQYQLVDDDPLGDTCSDKWLAFRELLKNGGDNEYLFDLTFDLEESRPASSSTITLTGKVKNMTKRVVAGEHTVYIEGDFEFWCGEE